MKGTYSKDSVTLNEPYTGKITGDESKTEQEYIPIAVQIKRMIKAGDQLLEAKHDMYQLGWDEDYNLNSIKPHAINMNMNRVEMQEIIENAEEEISKANTRRESIPTEKEPEKPGSSDIQTEENTTESTDET